MISAHTTAPHTWVPAGSPSHRERIASTMIVNGLTCANARSPAGIVATGTNAEEMNVSGKIAMKPIDWAASGVEATNPANANTQENAKPISSSSPNPATTSPTEL